MKAAEKMLGAEQAPAGNREWRYSPYQAVARDKNVCFRILCQKGQWVLQPHSIHIRHHNIKAHICEGQHQPNLFPSLHRSQALLLEVKEAPVCRVQERPPAKFVLDTKSQMLCRKPPQWKTCTWFCAPFSLWAQATTSPKALHSCLVDSCELC